MSLDVYFVNATYQPINYNWNFYYEGGSGPWVSYGSQKNINYNSISSKTTAQLSDYTFDNVSVLCYKYSVNYNSVSNDGELDDYLPLYVTKNPNMYISHDPFQYNRLFIIACQSDKANNQIHGIASSWYKEDVYYIMRKENSKEYTTTDNIIEYLNQLGITFNYKTDGVMLLFSEIDNSKVNPYVQPNIFMNRTYLRSGVFTDSSLVNDNVDAGKSEWFINGDDTKYVLKTE